MPPRPRGDSGFTLPEILVALVVLGLLLSGLGLGIRYGISALERQANTIAAHDELDSADHLLRGLIARLDPAAPVAGTAHAVGFRSDLPEMVPHGTINQAKLLQHIERQLFMPLPVQLGRDCSALRGVSQA